jgi:hypothetical protein
MTYTLWREKYAQRIDEVNFLLELLIFAFIGTSNHGG